MGGMAIRSLLDTKMRRGKDPQGILRRPHETKETTHEELLE
jgi:hypothetical protein